MNYDLVIVGSGVAATQLALPLIQAGWRICILEAGGKVERQDILSRHKSGFNRDPSAAYAKWPHLPIPGGSQPANEYFGTARGGYGPRYVKAVGGTTWMWTGVTQRFLPEDFHIQSLYGVGADWPIDYTELEPYYVAVERMLGVAGDTTADHGSPRSAPFPLPPLPATYSDKIIGRRLHTMGVTTAIAPSARLTMKFDSRPPCCGNNTCTPVCPSGAKFSASMDMEKLTAAGATLIEHATAYRVDIDENALVKAIFYKKPDGTSHRISGRNFVLACNAIETPRLALMSNLKGLHNGFCNSSSLVGKGLMDHPGFACDFSLPEPLYPGRGPQSASLILHGRSGNFRRHHSAIKMYIANDPAVQSEAVRLIESGKHYGRIISELRESIVHSGMIGGELEQLPENMNCVELDYDRMDPLGMPMPRIRIFESAYVRKGQAVWMEQLETWLRAMGATKINFSARGSANHPAGTMRMGTNPATSVVDRNCRSHDHPNLYIAGSSVFPTTGTANPTLTIAALSRRLANHLLQQQSSKSA